MTKRKKKIPYMFYTDAKTFSKCFPSVVSWIHRCGVHRFRELTATRF